MFLLASTAPCAENEQVCRATMQLTSNEDLARVADVLIGTPLALAGLLVLGLGLRWVLHKLVNRVVRRAQDGVLPDAMGMFSRRRAERSQVAEARLVARDHAQATRRVQRAKTMGDLLKSIITGVIVAVIGTMMLSEVGVDIAPIIASAGIIGVALGFGAQSLVKDFLSGIFMIFEDQYGVGDWIDAGSASGTVEAVSLRVTRLRDINGTVWYVRNGEILRVGNMSQNWARAVVDVDVAYGEDLTRATQVLREVAHSLWEDEEFRAVVIEEPEVTGVEKISAGAVTLRVMFKTLPMEQWAVARELRQRIKARLDHEGIAPATPA